MMFQEPAAELFDRSRTIIHGKISIAVLAMNPLSGTLPKELGNLTNHKNSLASLPISVYCIL